MYQPGEEKERSAAWKRPRNLRRHGGGRGTPGLRPSARSGRSTATRTTPSGPSRAARRSLKLPPSSPRAWASSSEPWSGRSPGRGGRQGDEAQGPPAPGCGPGLRAGVAGHAGHRRRVHHGGSPRPHHPGVGGHRHRPLPGLGDQNRLEVVLRPTSQKGGRR